MAHLNTIENLIQSGANKENALHSEAFQRVYNFFTDLSYLANEDYCAIITSLYQQKHKRLTFENIARSHGLSLSKLSRIRKAAVKMFLQYTQQIIDGQHAA